MGVRDYSVRDTAQYQLLEPAEPPAPNNYQISIFLYGLVCARS